MIELLDTLYDCSPDKNILTSTLKELYGGRLAFSKKENRPYVILNFVQSIDGIVSLNDPDRDSGAYISGRNQADRFVMGLLRTIAGAVAMGANAIRQNPKHLWIPSFISPQHLWEYEIQRERLHLPGEYLNVFVSNTGQFSQNAAIFQAKNIRPLFITTQTGANLLKESPLPGGEVEVAGDKKIDLDQMMTILFKRSVRLLLVEGGPTFAGSLFGQDLVDEIFLSTSTRIVGNSRKDPRPTLAENCLFAPGNFARFRLISLKIQGQEGFLFRRYQAMS